MVKRTKKPPVRPERRADWLRRYEELGETPPKIADADGFDVRTVRKQLEIARRERDQRDARISYVRQALELHHQELCQLAEEFRGGSRNRFSHIDIF